MINIFIYCYVFAGFIPHIFCLISFKLVPKFNLISLRLSMRIENLSIFFSAQPFEIFR